jgi:hypothetical protein
VSIRVFTSFPNQEEWDFVFADLDKVIAQERGNHLHDKRSITSLSASSFRACVCVCAHRQLSRILDHTHVSHCNWSTTLVSHTGRTQLLAHLKECRVLPTGTTGIHPNG